MKLRLRWHDSIFIALFLYLFAAQIQAIWPFTIDDMYISLRYAKNWAAGNGLVWNVHASPVEGYSNFSFVVIGAVTLLLNGNPVVALKIAGLLGLFFTCIFIYLISRFWFAKREALLPCLCLLFYKGQIIWAVSGLETAVYEALICGAVYFCFKGMGYCFYPQGRGQSRLCAFIFAGIFLSIAGMTRPEAPVLMSVFFLLICWDRPKSERKKYGYHVLFFSLTILLCYAPYFFWRLHYFGYLFPNSVYCKGMAQTNTFALDIHYMKLIWPFILLSLPACIKAQDRRHYFLWVPSVAYLLMLIDADPVVAFANRLFLPAFALLLPLAVQGISTILLWYLQERDTGFLYCFYFLVGCATWFFIPRMTLAEYRYFSETPIKGEQLRSDVASWLASHAALGSTVVLADSGQIPYQSELNFIDSYCLNNVVMAHYPVAQRDELFCKNSLLAQPEIIILTSLVEHGTVIYTPADACLNTQIRQRGDYKLTKYFESKTQESTYRYELLVHQPH